MSHYFRTAAKCDLTIASKAPVPLYNDDGVSDESPRSAKTFASEPPISPVPKEVEDSSPHLDDFQRSRATLDRDAQEKIRLSVKREANVLQHLARQEEAQRQRAAQEAALNEKLISKIRAEKAPSESAANGSAREDTTEGPSKVMNNTTSYSDAEDDVSLLPPTAATGEAIAMFQRIRLEEERQFRRSQLLGPLGKSLDASYGGSIIGLYNALTLEDVMKTLPASVAPSVAMSDEQERRKFIFQNDILAADPTVHFLEKAEASEGRRERLADRHAHIKAVEALKDATEADSRIARDADAVTVLKETMVQDHARRAHQESCRLLKIAQFHESSLVGAFDTERRTDPLLPHFPENVLRALQQSKKPPHPVDVYQAAVRERQ